MKLIKRLILGMSLLIGMNVMAQENGVIVQIVPGTVVQLNKYSRDLSELYPQIDRKVIFENGDTLDYSFYAKVSTLEGTIYGLEELDKNYDYIGATNNPYIIVNGVVIKLVPGEVCYFFKGIPENTRR